MKINLTRLLNRQRVVYPFFPTTDASYLPVSKDRASQEEVYSFELEKIGGRQAPLPNELDKMVGQGFLGREK